MSESPETTTEVGSVILEIEQQLDNLLSQKREDIERALAAAIQKEKEAAHKKLDELGKEFDRERGALDAFRQMVAEAEAERTTILEELRKGIQRALQFQAEVENLSRRATEEIRKVNDLHEKLESLRQRTAERAGFLKKDLREKFGIITDVPEGEDVRGPDMDLDRELENLRRIKTLLAGESSGGGGEERPRQEGGESWGLRIPEIRDLIQASNLKEDGETESVPVEEGPGERRNLGV